MIARFWSFVQVSCIGFLVWFFGDIDISLQVLITLCIIDYITGVTAAGFEHKLSSSVGFKGIMRKCMLFCFVGIANLLDRYLPNNNGSLRGVICLAYVINESLSIIENARRMGVYIPKPIENVLMKLNNNEKEKQEEAK